MSLTPPSFDQAEYTQVPPPLSPQPLEPADGSAFAKAIVFGLVGVVAGALIYAAFILITHIQIGYLAIGVAYLVARAMMVGSGNRGGRNYQIAAIVLTLVSVALGNAFMILWSAHSDQGASLSLGNLMVALPYGFEEPFLEFKDNAFGGAIGIFILYIGLRAAWRMTSGLPGASQHPFRR